MKTLHSLAAIEAHLQTNIHPILSSQAITGILGTLDKLNEGELSVNDLIAPGSDCNVLNLCQDLHIDLIPTELDELEPLTGNFPRRDPGKTKN